MTDRLRKAAQAALDALEQLQGGCTDHNDGTVEAITVWCPEIIDALRAALAEPQAEPVAYLHDVVADDGEPDQALSFEPDNFPLNGVCGFRSVGVQPLFASPQPARAVPPLTDAEMLGMSIEHFGTGLPGVMYQAYVEFARAVEAEVRRQFGVEGE